MLIERTRRWQNFNFREQSTALYTKRMRITVYTSCKLIRMLWNEDDYSPDTGIAGKLRDRGRFFITTDTRARSFLALVLRIAGIRSATLKSCEFPWEEPAMRWRARLIRHRQQSRTKETKEIMKQTFIVTGARDILRKTKKLV